MSASIATHAIQLPGLVTELLLLHRESATEVELNDAERALGFKIPDSLRVIYRLHNGQELSCDDRFPNLMPSSSMFHGLFGGWVTHFCCY